MFLSVYFNPLRTLARRGVENLRQNVIPFSGTAVQSSLVEHEPDNAC